VKTAVLITYESLEGHTLLLKTAPAGCGALAEFSGLVRPQEDGRTISALVYEAYLPMAEQQIENILRDLASECSCEEARVIHRIGTVPVGCAAIIVQVAAKHRAEAFTLLGRFMDRLKQDVPIWKTRAI